jgi:hypothetical protein
MRGRVKALYFIDLRSFIMKTGLRPGLALAAMFLALTAVATAAPAPAGASGGSPALAVVPAQAPIVFQVRGVERVKDRLVPIVNAASPNFGPVLAAKIDEFLKSGIEGRKLDGLDKDGPVIFALLELPTGGGAEPPMVLIARVNNFKAFRDGLLSEDERKSLKKESGYEQGEINGKVMYFLDRSDYALVTSSKDAAEMLAKKPAGLDGKLSQDVARQLLENDLSLYVNLAAVNKEYSEQIKQAQQLLELAMTMAGGAEKGSAEYVKMFYGSLFQAIADGRALLVAFDFRPEGFNFQLQFQVAADSKTNKMLEGQKPTALAPIGDLPVGFTTYTASHLTGNMLKTMAPLLFGSMGGEGDAKVLAEDAVKGLLAAGLSGSYGATNIPPGGVQVQDYDDPNKAVSSMLKLFHAMGEGGTFQNAYLKGKPEIKEGAEQYKGFKLSSVSLAWDLDKFADTIPGGGDAAKAAIKKLLGEGMRLWFGTDGKRVVTVTAKDWETARQRLDAYLAGSSRLSEQAAYAKTRKQLPAETTMLMLADAGPFVTKMGDYMLSVLKAAPQQLPINLPDQIKPVKTETSFLGMSVTLRSETARVDVFVPVTGIREIHKVLAPLFLGGAQ